jgi:Zn-dependent metalloprotease
MAIGSDKAGEIWYRTLLQLKPQSNFYQVAIATVEAAGMIYGQNNQEQAAVRKAWEIVGVLKLSLTTGSPS